MNNFVVFLPEPNAVIDWMRQGQTIPVIEDMVAWLESIESNGPPEVIAYGRGDGMPLAEGPNSELVEFYAVWREPGIGPPYGAVVVLKIYSLPSA